MNKLCVDIGYSSLFKAGEPICGDHVEVAETEDGTSILVLADGLGSGVKASILATLTAKILSTMMSAGMRVQDCVSTIAATLPVCSVRKVAYSTFTILRITNHEEAELIQYDNPHVLLLRDGKQVEYARIATEYEGKTIYTSRFPLRENDVLVAFSDGAAHAGVGNAYNFGWTREHIGEFLEPLSDAGFTAKTLTTLLLDQCNQLYGGKPGDDTTVCVVRLRSRAPVHLMIGPPAMASEEAKMMSLFFSKPGKHIVCGGTTSSLAARYLGKPLLPRLDFPDPDIPPIATIEGVDLVTEGVITFNRVLAYARDYLAGNHLYARWGYQKDGASQIARLLFEDATDINFYVGKAVNPAHQNPNLPIGFSIKMRLVEELADALRRMGKRIKVSYF